MAQRPNIQPLREPNRASYPFGAPRCRIYRPSPSAMQSACGKQAWLLEFQPRCCRVVEPLMGWTATDDPTAQLRLKFSSLSAAVDYAEREGLDYDVIEPPARRTIRKSYRETIAGPGPECRTRIANTRGRTPGAIASGPDKRRTNWR